MVDFTISVPQAWVPVIEEFVEDKKANLLEQLELRRRKFTQEQYDSAVSEIEDMTNRDCIKLVLKDNILMWKKRKIIDLKNGEITGEIGEFNSLFE